MTPDEFTIQELHLAVGDGHTLYVQDWGNKEATTVWIVLHGGPGSQAKPKHKGGFDPTTQRVIFFDQRGCGNSTPYGSLEHNTTQDLIADISRIADELGVATFALHGSSWGSALALAYAVEHPERVSALAIGGIFTGSKNEIDWLDQGRFQTFYPDVWQDYLARTPEAHRGNPTAYHNDKVLNGSPEEQKASGYAYERLEAGVIKLDDRSNPDDIAEYDPAGIRMEMFYMANNCFMPDRHVMNNAHKLTMPVHIVQGRYDMVCPPITAYELHGKLPNSRLYWVISGHAHEHETQNVFSAIIAAI